MLKCIQSTSHSKVQSIRLAFKSYLQKDKMEGLQARLSAIRQQIILHFQNNSGFTDRKQEIVLISIKEGIATIRNTLQDSDNNQRQGIARLTALVENLERANADFSALKTNLTTFSEIVSGLVAQEHKRKTDILESLQYSTMASRYLTVRKAHEKTFHWVFDSQSSESTNPRSQFAFHNWLRSGTGIFWVSGKPGSGKSTLMKYLCEHSKATESLKAWAGSHHLVIAKFFFWHAGTSMQKSLEGLLQSIVFEILDKNQEWIMTLCPPEKSRYNSWSQTELVSLLACLARQRTMFSKFCFFIDGLDEYDGNMCEIVGCLKDIHRSANIKLCLSSRPWNCFEESFGNWTDHKLYLEDLTRNDIASYARDNLSTTIAQRYHPDSELMNDITLEIVEKAQGVFLWVTLAVRSLQREIKILHQYLHRDESYTGRIGKALWHECVLAEASGHLDADVVDQGNYFLIPENYRSGRLPRDLPSLGLLEDVIDRGLVSYLRHKAVKGFINFNSVGPQLLERTLANVGGRGRIDIILWLLDNGVEFPKAPMWSTETFFQLSDHDLTSWGTVSHTRILEVLLANGADVDSPSTRHLTWGAQIVQSLSVQPAERTLRVLQQLLRYGVDPNRRDASLDGKSPWEAFLNRVSDLGFLSVSSCHANLMEEFLRHGADPFVSVSSSMRSFSLVSLIEQYFPHDMSKRLKQVLNEEIDYYRSRTIPENRQTILSRKRSVFEDYEEDCSPGLSRDVKPDPEMCHCTKAVKKVKTCGTQLNPIIID
ncbi:hypothetical protein SLS54_004677 [Diplodia seriata]